MAKVGRPKGIKTSEDLYALFLKYKDDCKNNPIKVKDWVGKNANQVDREKERPLTMEGFECSIEYPATLDQYFSNKNDQYAEFSAICARIRKEIRQDQIAGGMAGIYNPSITQRLNNLVDKQEITLPKVGLDASGEQYE